MKRFPLWVTLVPLVAGIAGWYWAWDGYRDRLVADIRALVPNAVVTTSGFPYRLEATVRPARIGHSGPDLTAGGEADVAVVNRQPWSPDHSVFNLTRPLLRVSLGGLTAAHMSVRSDTAQASVHIDRRDENFYRGTPVLARMSIVWDKPTITTGLLPGTLTAASFEAHARETPSRPDPANRSPRGPMQAQLVFRGTGVRMGEGSPLALEAEVQVTATAPVRGFAGWANGGGTAELTRLTLADKAGEVLSMGATGVPAPNYGLLLNGTITTVCPATVAAAFAGQPAPSELRRRKAVVIPFQGRAGEAMTLGDFSGAPTQVLRQEAPCPRLR